MMKMGGDVLQSKSYLPSAIHRMYLLKVEMMPYAYWLLKKVSGYFYGCF